ncbi:MAG: PhzF family phenazine biosynthesis protein [Muribaculaceae bacterium]|nr:PhzF family phenazine biosynthesis protein [Muribaculaceae bacterium]
MKYFIVDAFTDKPFGGNPAGIVFLEKDGVFPCDERMRLIASEFQFSETAFVQRNGPLEFTVRYFTPCGEVNLCGHATIAIFGLLWQKGIVSDNATCRLHTLAGDLEVVTGETVMMQMAEPRILKAHVDVKQLHHIMAGNGVKEWPAMPIEIVSTGLPDIMMPVVSVEALNRLQPDMDALAEMSRQLSVIGVHAFALSDDGYTAHVRNFAPLYGIREESATGTANAALTYYLLHYGIIADNASCRFIQGEVMGRPSVVATRILNGVIYVGGKICVIAQGTLLV